MPQHKAIILASGSSYRQQLLKKLSIDFISKSPEIDEQCFDNEAPTDLAKRLAKQKTLALSEQFDNHLIIGSDQVAQHQHQQLTKPGNRETAISQLRSVAGNTVDFYTSICVLDSMSNKFAEDIDHCSVKFRPLELAEIETYVDMDKPYDCAGSFKSEGFGITLIESISGNDPNALIGLPLIKLIDLLASFGIKMLANQFKSGCDK